MRMKELEVEKARGELHMKVESEKHWQKEELIQKSFEERLSFLKKKYEERIDFI